MLPKLQTITKLPSEISHMLKNGELYASEGKIAQAIPYDFFCPMRVREEINYPQIRDRVLNYFSNQDWGSVCFVDSFTTLREMLAEKFQKLSITERHFSIKGTSKTEKYSPSIDYEFTALDKGRLTNLDLYCNHELNRIEADPVPEEIPSGLTDWYRFFKLVADCFKRKMSLSVILDSKFQTNEKVHRVFCNSIAVSTLERLKIQLAREKFGLTVIPDEELLGRFGHINASLKDISAKIEPYRETCKQIGYYKGLCNEQESEAIDTLLGLYSKHKQEIDRRGLAVPNYKD